MYKHYLITGGAGFIGSHLADFLIQQGKQVTSIDDLSTGRLSNIRHLLNNPAFKQVTGSVLNEALLNQIVSDVDVIIHLAATVGVRLIIEKPIQAFETNVLGTEKLLKVAKNHNLKILIASSSEVYGKVEVLPFSEENDVIFGPSSRPRWSYANSKLMDEFLALAYYREYKLPVVIARLFNTVGPRQTADYGMVMPRFIHQAVNHEPVSVYGDGSQDRCFCSVYDVRKAILQLSETPEAVGNVYNIGSTERISIMQLAKKIINLTQSKSDIIKISYADAYGQGFEDIKTRVPDIERITKLTGWIPQITLDETIMQLAGNIGYCGATGN